MDRVHLDNNTTTIVDPCVANGRAFLETMGAEVACLPANADGIVTSGSHSSRYHSAGSCYFPPRSSAVIHGMAMKLPIMPPMLDSRKTRRMCVTRFV